MTSQTEPLVTTSDVQNESVALRNPTCAKRGTGIELSHGVIIAVCNQGCSTYRVQRVHRHLSAGCDDCGSGSGSGS